MTGTDLAGHLSQFIGNNIIPSLESFFDKGLAFSFCRLINHKPMIVGNLLNSSMAKGFGITDDNGEIDVETLGIAMEGFFEGAKTVTLPLGLDAIPHFIHLISFGSEKPKYEGPSYTLDINDVRAFIAGLPKNGNAPQSAQGTQCIQAQQCPNIALSTNENAAGGIIDRMKAG